LRDSIFLKAVVNLQRLFSFDMLGAEFDKELASRPRSP
jgi:hypothetical protein